MRPEQILINVTDSGPGIQDVRRAMKPGFSTASEWIREMGFGAGMGLSNVQRCADAMELTSDMGKGTHLTITFHLTEGKNNGTS